MRIICPKDILADGINIVGKAVPSKPSISVLECILLTAKDGVFKLLANDLELGIETKNIEADILEEGEIALDAKVFSDIIKRLPGEDVTIETTSNYITIIKSGESEFKILGQPTDDFPPLPGFSPEKSFEMPSAALRDIIRQTIFSVSADESKPAMTGELFTVSDGVLSVVSVDGFRISQRRATVTSDEAYAEEIIPGKTLGELFKILDTDGESITRVSFSDKHCLFETEEALIVTRLIEGKFLNFENVINAEYSTFMIVETDRLLRCAERASLISRETKKSPVQFVISPERLAVRSNSEMGVFYEDMPAEVDGAGLEISFNPRFLIDVLKVVDEERIKLSFTTPLSPCIITGVDGEEYKYLILPLRNR